MLTPHAVPYVHATCTTPAHLAQSRRATQLSQSVCSFTSMEIDSHTGMWSTSIDVKEHTLLAELSSPSALCWNQSALVLACMGCGSALVFLHRMRDGHAHLHRGCLCACWPGPREEEVGLDPRPPGSPLSCKATRFLPFCLGTKPSLVRQ